MIDADPVPRLIQPTSASWIVEADYLGLIRNDEHTIVFGIGPATERVVMQSDSMAGIHLGVTKSLGQSRGQTQAGLWEAGLVMAEDESRYIIGTDNWDITSRMMTAEGNGGLDSTVFGVRTKMMVGARYAFVEDEYIRMIGPGFLLQDDLVRSRNHAMHAQGKLAMSWERGRWSIAASLAGGVGVNAAHQTGDVFDNPAINAYKSEQWTHSTLTELTTRASVRVFRGTDLQVGFYGLSLSEMASSRRGLGGEGNLDDARYLGLVVGVRQCF